MRSRFLGVGLSCLVMAAAAAGCGTSATGISATIQPDPVSAAAVGGTTRYAAGWDVIVSDLTGEGGTVESIDATVGGDAVVLDSAQTQTLGPTSSQASLGAFDRRTFHQSGTFALPAGGSATLSVTAHFRAGDGTTHQATAQARVSPR